MPAEILDDVEVQDTEDVADLPPSEEVPQGQLVEQLQDTSQTGEPELPDKYQGKSIREVVAMHQEAEKVIGRHSGEVGELRQFVDGFIKGKLEESQPAPEEPEEDKDFFEDPEAAVSKAISTHPDVQRAREQSDNFQKQSALSKIRETHPDMQDVLQASGFQEWVKGSPVRMELYQRADAFDYDAANELIGNYKERMAGVQKVVKEEQQTRQKQVNAASTGSASGSPASTGSKRKYRRADIIKLMKTDPDRYDRLQDEILLAYKDGRVI